MFSMVSEAMGGAPLNLYCIVTITYVTVVFVKTITTRVPEEDYNSLKQIEEKENKKQSEVIRKLLKKALEERRKKKALQLLKQNKVTIRKAAEIAKTTYIEMINLASEKGIDIGYSEEELEKDLERI